MTERLRPGVTNPRSDRVKAVRSLARRSARSRLGLLLAEGPQAAREAVIGARVRDLYLTPAAAERYPEIETAALERGIHVHAATPEVIEAMSPDAQGVLAVVHRLEFDVDEVIDARPRLIAVLDQLRDPGNAGTVIRAADAMGADAVLVGAASVDVQNPKVVRASAGSLFHLPVVTGVEIAGAATRLREAGLWLAGADAHGVLGLRDAAATGRLASPTAWFFGNEAHGLDRTTTQAVDDLVRIVLPGNAESLNVAMAATICLHASAEAMSPR